MKKILLLLLLNSACLFAQGPEQATQNTELQTVIPPSPSVASLMNFEEVPVDYYTGQPDINIPLFNKSIGKGLNLAIALRYSTMGVRVNERSSWVGTSWGLETGGVISRTVRGLPDDNKKGIEGNIINSGVLHLPDYWNFEDNTIVNGYDRANFLWNAGGTRTDKYDTELDLYQYSFLGETGRFVIVKEGNILVPKLISVNSKIKIELEYDTTSYQVEKFLVTDARGNRYSFDIKENAITTVVSGNTYFGVSGGSGLSQNIIKSVNAWHLSRIETSNLKELASFEYTNHNHQYLASKSIKNRDIIDPPSNWNEMLTSSYNPYSIPPKSEHSQVWIESNSKKIAKISFRDGTSIDFSLKTETHPETNGAVLELVSIKNSSGQENKSYKLNYQTTSKSFQGGVDEKRLWLKTVEEIAANKTNQYILEYNDKENLNFFDKGSDNWGYNIGPEVLLGCGLSKPDKNAIQKGLIKNITYPTGGVKEFVFENNTISYRVGGNPLLIGSPIVGVYPLSDDEYREMNPDNWESEYLSMNFDSQTDNANQGSLTKYSFTITQTHEVKYKKISTNVSFSTDPEPIDDLLENTAIKITKDANTFATILLSDDEASFTLSPGTYDVRLHSFSTTARILADLCIGYKTYNTNISRFVYGGGVRIKETLFNENPDAVNPAIKTTYLYEELGTMGSPSLNFSYGAIDGNLLGITRKYEKNEERWLFGYVDGIPCGSPGSFTTYTLRFLVNTKELNSELTKGNYVGYKKVRVLKENNGYSTFTYTSPQDYFNDIAVFTYPYIPAKNIDYKRGLLLHQENYNQSDELLKKTSNTYTFEEKFISNNYSGVYAVDSKWKQFYEFYDSYRNGHADHPLLCGVYQHDYLLGLYPNGTGAFHFMIKDDINSGWAKLNETNTKEYYYNSGIPSEVSSRATYEYDDINFQVNKQDMFYNEGGVETHVESKSFYPTSSSSYPGSANSSSLTGLNNINEVIGTETYKNGKRISSTRNMYKEFSPGLVLPEIVQSSKGEVTPPAGGGLYDPLSNLEDRLTYHRYDEYGNPLEVSKKDGTRISYIWGYSHTKPIAKIEGASYAEIATALGISETQLLAYNELNLIQINGLRNSLSIAMTSTYVYKLLVGMTSSTDPRGYTTTYEYDEFNRLKHVKDTNGNILSKNQYQYRTQN